LQDADTADTMELIMPKLTKTFIDRLTYTRDGGSQFVWDSERSGPGVRINPSNDKTFISINDGIDPFKQQEQEVFTITDLCRQYIEKHAKVKKRTWKEDRGKIDFHILSRFGNMAAIATAVYHPE
jgi:hypothetical protein